jgi:hypothetical protein
MGIACIYRRQYGPLNMKLVAVREPLTVEAVAHQQATPSLDEVTREYP